METIAKTILLADSTVSNLAGNNVYVGYDPLKGKTARIIILSVTMNRGSYTSSGQFKSRRGSIEVNCIAGTDAAAYALMTAAINALVAAEGDTYDSDELVRVEIAETTPEPIEQEGEGIPQSFGYQTTVNYSII